MSDTSHHVLTGKVDITSNLLVGSSHLFVDTNNNRVGLVTTDPHAGLHVNSNAYVNTDLRVGNQIEINATAGRIKAASFEGDGSLLQNTPPGADGADGAAATIAVGTTTTGAAGSSASVTNSGTSSAAVFNFTIPKGDQGIQGIPGNDGANGADGTNYFTLSGSNIYRSTGNVGIGNTNPSVAKLHIGPLNGDHLYLASGNNAYGWKLDTDDQGGGAVPFRIKKRTADVDTTVLTIKNQDGFVGIGASVPACALDITGEDVMIRGNTPSLHFSEGTNGMDGAFRIHYDGANQVDGNNFLAIQHGTNFADTSLHCTRTGNVGVGTSSPGAVLDIQGSQAFDASTTLRVLNPAANYGRTQLHLVGRYEANNDGWSAGGARNAIMFKSQSSQNSAITNQWTIQSFPNGTSNDLGFMSGSNDAPRFIIRGNGFAEFFPDATTPLKVTNQGTATDTYNFVLNGPRPGTSGGGATHFINGETRSQDGGTNTYTIRNDSGQLRLGHSSYTTLFQGNHLRMSEGDNSFFHFGPNGTWAGELFVGATSDRSSSAYRAQCISTNGNLHLDAGDGRETYINYYSGSATRVNNILRMEGSQTEWLTMGGLLTHRYTHNTYSWGRWNGPHHFDLYSNTNFTQYNGNVNTVPFYINFYSHAPIRTYNYTTITSDDRIKINEKYIENATQTLLKLKPQNYDKLACLEKDRVEGEEVWFKKDSGLITQDVYYDAPELRHLVLLPLDAEVPDEKPYVDDDPQKDPDYSMWGSEPAGLQYQGFIPYLIKSNQEIYEELQTTKSELQSEKEKVATMELLVASLVKRVGDLENLVI